MLNFITVTDENHAEFHRLMQMYANELDKHQKRRTDPEMLRKWTERIIENQYAPARCLRLCTLKSDIICFLYGRIDLPEDKGYKKLGFGYVMEFFVLPKYRKKGFGKQMYQYMEVFFISKNISQLYLTADPISGKPFWEKMGFVATGEISPNNKQEIYEKPLSKETGIDT